MSSPPPHRGRWGRWGAVTCELGPGRSAPGLPAGAGGFLPPASRAVCPPLRLWRGRQPGRCLLRPLLPPPDSPEAEAHVVAFSRGARPRLWLPPVGFLWGTRRGDRAPLAPDRAVPMAVTLPAGRRSPSIQTPTRERPAACGASQPGRPTSDSCGQTLAEPSGVRGARSAHSRLLGGPQSWLRGTDFQRLSRGQHLSAPRLPLMPVQKRGAHGAFVESLFAVSAQVS